MCSCSSGPSYTMADVIGDNANVTHCDAFNVSQRNILSGTRGVTGIFCLIATVIILVLFIYIQAWKNFRCRILLFLTASTVVDLFFFILQALAIWKETVGKGLHAELCKTIGFFILYFGWQQLLLVSSITVYLYFYYVRHNDIFGPRRQGEEVPKQAKLGEALLYATLLLVPLIPAGLVFINDGYGETRGWCWIRSRDSDCKPFVEGVLQQIFLWYMWCVICGVVTLAFLIKIICAMRSNAIQHSGKADRIAEEYNRRKAELVLLLVYLGMFHVVNFIELVACIISYTVPDNLFALWEIYAVLSPVSTTAIPLGFSMVVCCCHRDEIRSAKSAWSSCLCGEKDLDADSLTKLGKRSDSVHYPPLLTPYKSTPPLTTSIKI